MHRETDDGGGKDVSVPAVGKGWARGGEEWRGTNGRARSLSENVIYYGLGRPHIKNDSVTSIATEFSRLARKKRK